ncbi:MAG TPA: S-adenosylmethionine decarboxylase [Pyrinomonadaceae bacterium]|jgi:S-adenosylmethionine decarboxylase|nr:S-adenosylmethionine decarboxylase [Pyrinomonadaceae bacterium]
MLIVGTEWLIDAAGCRADALRDVEILGAVFGRIVEEMRLHVVGEVRWHVFPAPGGITGFAVLSESHLACHTYPEFGVATFNLYCCRTRPDWVWEERLRELLGATTVSVRVVERSVSAEVATAEELLQETTQELLTATTTEELLHTTTDELMPTATDELMPATTMTTATRVSPDVQRGGEQV